MFYKIYNKYFKEIKYISNLIFYDIKFFLNLNYKKYYIKDLGSINIMKNMFIISPFNNCINKIKNILLLNKNFKINFTIKKKKIFIKKTIFDNSIKKKIIDLKLNNFIKNINILKKKYLKNINKRDIFNEKKKVNNLIKNLILKIKNFNKIK
ncbi:hypothetical protein ACT2CR_00395 [Candidatus Vidania fulgoroideorum]